MGEVACAASRWPNFAAAAVHTRQLPERATSSATAYLVAPRSALGAVGPDARSTELG
jgi:hypothetical protein